jgi:hypothetical protein
MKIFSIFLRFKILHEVRQQPQECDSSALTFFLLFQHICALNYFHAHIELAGSASKSGHVFVIQKSFSLSMLD